MALLPSRGGLGWASMARWLHGLSRLRLGRVVSSWVFRLSRNLVSREQDLEKDRPGLLVQLAAAGICFGKWPNSCFYTENRGFGSFSSSKPWDLMSHIIQNLQLVFKPLFPIHRHPPRRYPFPSHPSRSGPHEGSASPVTHPALGRSSPRGRGGTGGCQARRADAGRTRKAVGWPCRRAGVGAAAPCTPRGLPRRRGFRCPGRCCGRRESVRGEDLHFYFRRFFYP